MGYETLELPTLSAIQNTISEAVEDQLITAVPVPVYTEIKEEEDPKKIPLVLLTKTNMLMFRGPVTAKSMNELKNKLIKLSHKLPSRAHIYLVLDTPGGGINAGMSFIDVAKAIPQKVHTITLFAASMGFQIAQNLDNRYITPSGTLMSHRAYISGFEGEIPGEGIIRLNHLLALLKRMDTIAARRVGMTFKDYRELVRDEYWVDGDQAVAQKAADRTILLKCSKDLASGTEEVEVKNMFGSATLTFSKCPLMTAPLKIAYNYNQPVSAAYKIKFQRYVEGYYENRRGFVRKYITTGEFKNYIK